MDTEGAGPRAELRERLQAALGGAYAIERELGGGGMSRVFVAEDARLGRRVVVKVLHPDLAAGLSARRFEREVRLAARLQHPHVIPLLSAGDVGGLPYYTMPFVDGESLRARLAREGALPIPDTVRLVRELADALAYAHGQGVVHRDLKPENILLSGDHAVVADFGVAKALASATRDTPEGEPNASATQGATGLGVAVGTPAYMAPEQAAADPATDHRADLYALGLIAYEALAGGHPFAGRGPQAMLAAQLTEVPVPPGERRPEVPPAVSALVMRLLAKRPDDRPRNAQDVVRDVDTLWTLHSAASVSSPESAWRPAVDAAERRVAVAPFDNQTGDSALAPLGRLTSDWIAHGIAEAGFAEVIDPQAVRAAWSEAAGAAALGAATGAHLVVTGSYSREGDNVRIIARITDALDGRLLQAMEPVSAPAMHSQQAVVVLLERVLGAIGGLLDARTQPGAVVVATRPPNLEAYRHWSAAIEHWFRNEFREALPELLAAARADSTFAGPLLYAGVAHAVLGETAVADSFFQAAERMRGRLSPTDRHLLDVWKAESRGDWAGALRAAREAARLSPGFMIGLAVTWWSAIRVNRPREALEALARGDPYRPPLREYAPYWEALTQAHHMLGNYEAELAAARYGRRLHPEHVPVVYAEARALAALGRVPEAERRMDDALDLPPDPLHTHGEVTWALGRELRAHGQERAAQAAFARALAWYDSRPAQEQATAGHRARLAEALYAAGKWSEAWRHFEALAREGPDDARSAGDHGTYGLTPLGPLDYRGYLGALAARRHDRVEALASDQALASLGEARLRGRHTFWRARIAALTGDCDRAVELIREALRQGRTSLVLHAEADLTALQDLPAFQDIVRAKN